jgi:hypothetical protein
MAKLLTARLKRGHDLPIERIEALLTKQSASLVQVAGARSAQTPSRAAKLHGPRNPLLSLGGLLFRVRELEGKLLEEFRLCCECPNRLLHLCRVQDPLKRARDRGEPHDVSNGGVRRFLHYPPPEAPLSHAPVRLDPIAQRILHAERLTGPASLLAGIEGLARKCACL